MGRKHDEVARRIAQKDGGKYSPNRGVDVVTKRRATEVEPAGGVRDGIRQLQGHRKPVYIAGTDQKAVDAAREATKGTTVGVRNPQGKVVKPSTRKRR